MKNLKRRGEERGGAGQGAWSDTFSVFFFFLFRKWRAAPIAQFLSSHCSVKNNNSPSPKCSSSCCCCYFSLSRFFLFGPNHLCQKSCAFLTTTKTGSKYNISQNNSQIFLVFLFLLAMTCFCCIFLAKQNRKERGKKNKKKGGKEK